MELKMFLEKFWQLLDEFLPKNFRPRPAPQPQFSTAEISEFFIFCIKSVFFDSCGTALARSMASTMKMFLETLLGIFGPGRKNFGHLAPTTLICDHRNFCKIPFWGKNCHFFHLSPPVVGRRQSALPKCFW